MGRELRRVPPHWEHPKDSQGQFIPLFDATYETAVEEYAIAPVGLPPNPARYRAPFGEPPTWFQAYENITEGTPVTPPFATAEELIAYLVEFGDRWTQEEAQPGWMEDAARHFVLESGYCCTMVCTPEGITPGFGGYTKHKEAA